MRHSAIVMLLIKYTALQVVSIVLVSDMAMWWLVSAQIHTTTSFSCLPQCAMELRLLLLTLLTLRVRLLKFFNFHRAYVIVDGKVIKMAQLNEYQLV